MHIIATTTSLTDDPTPKLYANESLPALIREVLLDELDLAEVDLMNEVYAEEYPEAYHAYQVPSITALVDCLKLAHTHLEYMEI